MPRDAARGPRSAAVFAGAQARPHACACADLTVSQMCKRIRHTSVCVYQPHLYQHPIMFGAMCTPASKSIQALKQIRHTCAKQCTKRDPQEDNTHETRLQEDSEAGTELYVFVHSLVKTPAAEAAESCLWPTWPTARIVQLAGQLVGRLPCLAA